MLTSPGLTALPYIGRSVYESEGGILAYYVAGAAIALNDVVMIDTTADDQVVKATSAGQNKIVGVCVGRFPKVGLKGGSQADFSAGPAINEIAIVQSQETVTVTAGVAISRGDILIPDTVTAGRVMTGLVFVAPYVHTVGKALQAATVAGTKIRCRLSL